MNKELISIIIVSYRSNINQINKSVLKLAEFFKVIIIENSKDKFVQELENKHSNIQVHISNHNNGNGAGINKGLKLSKTKYSIYMDLDVDISVKNISKLAEEAEKIKNFTMLIPNINSKFKIKNIKKCYKFTGCVMLFNMHEIKDVGFFDENIFMYYEEIDFAYRCKKLKKNIFLIPSVNLLHYGQSSVEAYEKYNELKALRQWHYMWSKFYFYKKHFGVLSALIATFFDLILNTLKIGIFFFSNKNKFNLCYAGLQGLLTSIKGEKSSKRLKI